MKKLNLTKPMVVSKLIRNESAVADAPPIQKLVVNLLPAMVRNDTLEGQDYIVVPMVILTEGVHAGSDGPLYYPKEELSKTPATWNYKPIVVYHPEMNGVGISACDPVVINNRKVGVMMNTRFENGKLKSEAWINKDRANAVDDRIMAAVEAGQMMELSTGVFVDVEDTAGSWGGEDYMGISRNYRPDHLALLPDQIGACSIADGAGLLRNASPSTRPKEMVLAVINKVMERMGISQNEMSFSNIRETLATLLRKKFNANMEQGPYLWVEDVYTDFVIYEKDGKLFRLGYTTSDTGVALSEDNAVEVVRVTEYRTVEGAFVGNEGSGDQHNITNNKETKMDKKKLVDAIVGNSGWSEADREKLNAFSVEQLTAIRNSVAPADGDGEGAADGEGEQAPAAKPTNKPATTEPAAATPPTGNKDKNKVVSLSDYVNAAPSEIREVLTNSVDVYNQEKQQVIAAIVANEQNQFTEEELKSRPLGELRKLARLAAREQEGQQPETRPNYAGQAPVPSSNAGVEEPMEMPEMKFGS